MKIKRILGLLLAVLMLATCVSFTFANAETTAANVLYVSDEGSDDADGLTPKTPIKSYKKAVETLAENGGTIVLVGDTTFKKDEPIMTPVNGTLLVTSIYDDIDYEATLIHDRETRYNGGKGIIIFENIRMTQTKSWEPTQFYSLTVEFGEGVVGPGKTGDNSPAFILGGDGSGSSPSGGKMIVRSTKNFRTFNLACGRHPLTINDIDLEYYGGDARFSVFAGVSQLSNRPNKIGNANFLVESQPKAIENFINLKGATAIEGAVQIIFNNSSKAEYTLGELVPADGIYVVYSGDGGRADFTEESGVFKLSSTEHNLAYVADPEGNVTEYELEADGLEYVCAVELESGKEYEIIYTGYAEELVPYEVVMEKANVYKNQHNISFNGNTIANKNEGYKLASGAEVPFTINFEGTNYLPARKISEILGITIGYEADTRTVLIDTRKKTDFDATDGIVKDSKLSGAASVSVAKNSVIIKVDGKKVVLQDENFKTQSGTEVPCSLIYEGTTYLPVRKISELLGIGIDYDSETGTVLISNGEDDIDVTPGVQQALSNTYNKLTKDKELTVAYIGGSVTQGYGADNPSYDSWPAQIGRWLEERYPDTKIANHNMAIGGTGSYSATFRYDYEIAPLDPDLLFIEYAINDWGEDKPDLTSEQVTQTVESIVRQAYEVNPNIDIIFVFTFSSNVKTEDFYELVAHRNVAEHYDLPYIKMSEVFYTMLEETGTSFSKYYMDHVHPNTVGYQFFGKEITALLETELKKAKAAGVKEITAHVLPETTISKAPLLTNATLVPAKDIDLTGATGWKLQSTTNFVGCGLRYGGRLYGLGTGSKFTFTFTGTDFGMFVGGRPEYGIIRCTLEDGTSVDVNGYLSYGNPLQKIIFENLESGEHTVTVEIIGKDDRCTATTYGYEIGAIFYN